MKGLSYQDNARLTAYCSIFLYLSLSLVSSFYYRKICIKLSNRLTSAELSVNNLGRFDESKRLFFLLLAVSAILDIPIFIACIVLNCPQDCDWSGADHTFYRILHILAVCGYTVCIGIPLFLWSDIVCGRDGNLFSLDKRSFTKSFFHFSLGSYFLLELLTIVGILSFYHHNFDLRSFEAVTNLIEAFFITLLTAGWFWYGIRLQVYIRRVCFQPAAERQILTMINIVMFTITISYLARAVLLLTNFFDGYAGFRRHPVYSFAQANYMVWTAGTRWLPYILSSFLLIYVLQRSSGSSSSVKCLPQPIRVTSWDQVNPTEHESSPVLHEAGVDGSQETPRQQQFDNSFGNSSGSHQSVTDIRISDSQDNRLFSADLEEFGGSTVNPLTHNIGSSQNNSSGVSEANRSRNTSRLGGYFWRGEDSREPLLPLNREDSNAVGISNDVLEEEDMLFSDTPGSSNHVVNRDRRQSQFENRQRVESDDSFGSFLSEQFVLFEGSGMGSLRKFSFTGP